MSPAQHNYYLTNFLGGVSCSGPSACIAVGAHFVNPQSNQTLIESWNGSVWSIVPSPNTSPTGDNALVGVSCSGPSACTAVGVKNANAIGGSQQTLIESWNGTVWSIVPSPNNSPTENNFLQSVSCTGPSACIAVGRDNNGTTNQTLIESWNGSVWSIVPSPNTSPTINNTLEGVSCSSPSACIAVGITQNTNVFQTLVESWNGSVWSIVPSPNASPSQVNNLDAVSCSGPSACTAVGYYRNSTGGDQGLIESWNGSAWSIVPSPPPSLNGVSCVGPSVCTAVGRAAGVHASQTLIESWNGTVWSIVPSPNTSPTQGNQLANVSCSGPSACTAVGEYDNATASQTLIESWNGTVWSIVPSPNVGPTGPTITTTSLPNGAAGSAYSATLEVSGGIPPYTWRLALGTKLPRGLRLDRAGTISGVPKVTGTSTFTVQVHGRRTPGISNSAEATLSITVS